MIFIIYLRLQSVNKDNHEYPIVSFRLKPRVYLKLEAIAAEAGQMPGGYLKKKLESNTNNFLEDLQFMKGDISEILHLLQSDDEGSKAVENTSN